MVQNLILKFDEPELLRTARVVQRFNKYKRNQSLESIVTEMRLVAQNCFTRSLGYVSTGGFMLTAYSHGDGITVGIVSSIPSHLYDDIMGESV